MTRMRNPCAPSIHGPWCSPGGLRAPTRRARHARNAYVWQGKLPVLGICYGMQLMAQALGGSVAPADRREYGHAMIHAQQSAGVFADIAPNQDVWMSHGDHITALPSGFEVLASSANSPIAAMGNAQGMIGIQFHPEVAHTPQGTAIMRNFLFEVCGLRGDWTPAAFIDEAVAQIQSQVGAQRVILALSGGVDSTVAAALLHRAIGDRLINVFVDNGLLRRNEPEQVEESLTRLGIPVRRVDARDRFLEALADIADPEQEAAHHRRDIHPRVRGRSPAPRAGGLPRPGHDLLRRDREPRAGFKSRLPHQEPPQRGRPAGHHAPHPRRAAAQTLQGRGAHRGRGAGTAPRTCVATSVSGGRVWPCACSAR